MPALLRRKRITATMTPLITIAPQTASTIIHVELPFVSEISAAELPGTDTAEASAIVVGVDMERVAVVVGTGLVASERGFTVTGVSAEKALYIV